MGGTVAYGRSAAGFENYQVNNGCAAIFHVSPSIAGLGVGRSLGLYRHLHYDAGIKVDIG